MGSIVIQQTKTEIRQERVSTYHIYLFSTCFLLSVIGGTVSTLMSVYLPVVVKEILGSTDPETLNTVSGYINALFIFGWAIGGFTWGVISDAMGRKKSLLLAGICYGIFTVLTGYMTHWWGIIACRFLTGFGVGGVLVISITYISEIWPKSSKAVYIGILSIAFPVGIFSAGVINNIVSSWREGFLIGVVPIIFAIAGAFLMRESAIWKKFKDNSSESQKLFSGVHKKNLIISSVLFGTMLIGLWAIFSWLPTWIQHLSSGNDAQKQRGISMMFLGVGGLTGGFFSGWIVNRFGSRKPMIICYALCFLLSFILFKTNTEVTDLVFIEILLLALSFGVSQGVLSSFIPQLFSTGIRATATGFSFNIGRIFTATVVLFVGILVTKLGGLGNSLFLFSFVFLIGLISILFNRFKN